MADKFPINEPSWALNRKINIDLSDPANPLGQMINGLQEFFKDENKQAVNEFINKRNPVFSKGRDFYRNLKNQTNQATNTLVDAVNTFSNDLELTGAKYYVARPFRGTINTARSRVVRYLNPTINNSPNFSKDAYMTGVTLVVSASQISQAITFLLAWLFQKFGKENNTIGIINNFLNTPFASPIAGALSQVPEFAQSIDRKYKEESGKWARNNFKLTEQLSNEFQDFYNNSVFPNVIRDVLDITNAERTETGELINDLRQDKKIEFGLLDTPSGELVPNSLYQVIDYDQVTYNNKEYTNGQIFKAVNNVLTYKAVGTGSVILKRGPALEKDIARTNSDFRDIIDFDAYDKWLDLLTFADFFGGLGDIIKQSTEVIKELGAGTTEVIDLVDKATNYVDNIVLQQQNTFNNTWDFLKNAVDRVNLNFNEVTFDTLWIPPTKGGLDEFRLIHSEYLSEYAPNAPRIEPNSVVFVATIAIGSGGLDLGLLTAINKIANLFDINLEEC